MCKIVNLMIIQILIWSLPWVGPLTLRPVEDGEGEVGHLFSVSVGSVTEVLPGLGPLHRLGEGQHLPLPHHLLLLLECPVEGELRGAGAGAGDGLHLLALDQLETLLVNSDLLRWVCQQ